LQRINHSLSIDEIVLVLLDLDLLSTTNSIPSQRKSGFEIEKERERGVTLIYFWFI